MEPDHEGREDASALVTASATLASPQWSPTMKVGKTGVEVRVVELDGFPAMEPDHEGREDLRTARISPGIAAPQWSPTMKVGKTTGTPSGATYTSLPQWSPTMKVGKTRRL